VGHHHLRLSAGDDVVVQGRLVVGGGKQVMTSEREAALLRRLIGPPRRTVSRADLLRSVWDAEVVEPSVLDATMARLRRRLQGTGLEILTVPGRGYLVMADVVDCDRTLAPTA
jgi:DNA-binding winged helix-turn-helix (wHTH) protein